MSLTIIEAVRNDHKILRKKLQEVKQDRDTMAPDLYRVYADLHAMNDVHMHSDEKTLYEALKAHGPSRADALESLQEHHLLRIREHELDEIPQSDEQWKAKYGVYAGLSHHHFDEEEDKLLKELEEEVSPGVQQELGRKFRENEKKARVPELAAT